MDTVTSITLTNHLVTLILNRTDYQNKVHNMINEGTAVGNLLKL